MQRLGEDVIRLRDDNARLVEENVRLSKETAKLKGASMALQDTETKLLAHIAENSQRSKELSTKCATLEGLYQELLDTSKKLVAENTKLKSRLASMSKKVKRFTDALEDSERDKDLMQAKINSYELACLYRHYTVNSFISKLGWDWSQAVDKITEKLNELEDGVLTLEDYKKWAATITPPGLVCSLDVIVSINQLRHEAAHPLKMSVAGQKQFIEKMRVYSWPSGSPHSAALQGMEAYLRDLVLKGQLHR